MCKYLFVNCEYTVINLEKNSIIIINLSFNEIFVIKMPYYKIQMWTRNVK